MPKSQRNLLPAWCAAGAALALLAGCSAIPVYHRPEMAIPGRWSGQPAGAAQAGASAPNPPQWWTSFGSSELDALVARGLADGFDLKIAMQRLEQARGRAAIAGAARFPQVGATLGHTAATGTASQQSASVQASMDLDPWGRNRAVAASAGALAQAAGFDAAAARASLVAAIAGSYFEAISLNERGRLAQLIAADAQQTLQLVETQARLGAASELEVVQQRNAVQTLQATIPILRQQRDQAAGTLAVLVGTIPEGFDLAAENLRGVRVPDVAGDAPAQALARLPEVRSAEAQLQAANFDVGAARAAFLPNVSLMASLGQAFNPAQALWSVAGSVLQPLFAGGSLEGQLRVDRARAEELVVSYRKAIAQALLAVENQLGAASAARDAERLDEAALASAQRALDLARIRLQHGATDFLSVLLSERSLYQAEDTVLQIRLQRLQAAVGLFGALGTGQPLLDDATLTAAAPSALAAPENKETP
jgi:NodT family efflux transporter outer membrane factor (OMF) lipoprotein